eukprot:355434-Chlamydomonas_euryale.AAC.2
MRPSGHALGRPACRACARARHRARRRGSVQAGSLESPAPLQARGWAGLLCMQTQPPSCPWLGQRSGTSLRQSRASAGRELCMCAWTSQLTVAGTACYIPA